jgi:hypothetical protein
MKELDLWGCYGTSGVGKSTRIGQLIAWLTEERSSELELVTIKGKRAAIIWRPFNCMILGRWVTSYKSGLISWASMDTFIRHDLEGDKSYELIARLAKQFNIDSVVFEGAVEMSNTPKYIKRLNDCGIKPNMKYAFIEFPEGGVDEFKRNIMSRSGPTGKAGNSFKFNKSVGTCYKRFVEHGGEAIRLPSSDPTHNLGEWILKGIDVQLSKEFNSWANQPNNSFLRDWQHAEQFMNRWGQLPNLVKVQQEIT